MIEIRSDNDVEIGLNIKLFRNHCEQYGAKSAGLALLPREWTPAYVSVSTCLHKAWQGDRAALSQIIDLRPELEAWMQSVRSGPCDGFIVRSSGLDELMADRGKLLSVQVPANADFNCVHSAAVEIFEHAKDRGGAQSIAIVVQIYLIPDGAGHLSNEVRLSPTRNQWIYEVDVPTWLAPKGLNSKFAPRPDPTMALRVQGSLPHATMRSVGLWINDTVGPRAHIEWFVSRKNFWVAQIDLEWPELDEGINPLDSSESSAAHQPVPAAAKVFRAHQIGVSTPWKKLKNLEEFDFTENNSPCLYLATAADVHNSICAEDTALAEEINLLTASRAVIRMEVHSSRVKPFNLPRTDTVDGYAAVKWLREQIEEYRPLVDKDEEIAFILHAFLPAKAGVWAYADPGQPIAFVDALWGLPDGLQVLPHDAYQVDVRQKKVSAQKIRFKPRFLMETSDGTWKYVDVLRAKSRSSTLSDKDAIEIGVRTAAIAEKLQQRAQIMWFSGVEPQYGVGRNLPWFRAREMVDPAPRQSAKFPSFRISKHRDLDSVPLTPVALLLDPEAELIRDDTFLDAVIAKAMERRLPVEIQGSTLSHTYYRLFSAGVAVNPPKFGDYSRSRKRRVFVKLVRDKIPDQIKKGGEIVIEARLPKSDISFALLGKLIEEIREFQIAKNSSEAIEEMADIVEVLRAISTEFELGWDDIEASRIEKRKIRGGFDERRVLLETSLSKPDLQEEQLREISLQDFEQPHTVGECGLLFPYSALFSKVAQGRLDLNEYTLEISVRLAPQGVIVSVEQRRRSLSRETQLELF